MVSSDICTLNYHFVCFLCAQLSNNFLQIVFFSKTGSEFFFQISLFVFNFWNFVVCWNPIKMRGFNNSEFFCSFNGKWEPEFLVLSFCPTMAVSWRLTVFQNLVCWNLYFYNAFGVRILCAKLSKKGNEFLTPQNKNKKFGLITEQLIFGYF